ncbi:MAG: methyltransferase domain-containing protein [bacterium]|nr:methyltransferase domain-containing protein [bacterium]
MNFKQWTKSSFSKSASTYNNIAELQFKIADILVSMLDKSKCVLRILDVGTGTGYLIDKLQYTFPNAKIYAVDLAFGMVKISSAKKHINRTSFVQADAEFLPYKNDMFDILISNSVYQWMENYSRGISELYRVIKPEGKFLFSMFGGETLCELGSSFIEAHNIIGTQHPSSHCLSFVDEGKLVGLLNRFRCVNVGGITQRIYYDNVMNLLTYLRSIGSHNHLYSSRDGLGNRRLMNKMKEVYTKKYSRNNKIFATYDILIAQGQK